MKILLCSFTFPPEVNGVANVAWQHAVWLSELGHEVAIATTAVESRSPLPFKVFEFRIQGNGRIGNPIRGEVEAYQQLLTSYSFDFIFFHCREAWSMELAIPVLPSIQAKTVLFSHGTTHGYLRRTLKGFMRWLAFRPYALRFASTMSLFDHYVFLTDKADKIRFSDRLAAQKLQIKNYSIIGNSADSSYFRSSPSKLFRESLGIRGKRILLCVSNYNVAKGQRELLKLFLKLDLRDVVLVLIGSKFNSFSDQLKKYAGDSLNDSVFILAGVEPSIMRAAYWEANLFVSLSHTEALPLVVLNAMAAGLPFLCTDVGCVSELEGGVTVKNLEEARTELVRLLFDDQQLKLLGGLGLISVREKFSEMIIKDKLRALIEQLI